MSRTPATATTGLREGAKIFERQSWVSSGQVGFMARLTMSIHGASGALKKFGSALVQMGGASSSVVHL